MLAAILVAIGGCSYVLRPHMLIDGSEFAVEGVSQLSEGARPEEIEEAVGAPWRRGSSRGRETWEYYSRYQDRGCTAYFLGFLPVQRSPKRTYRARLVFGADGLERATLWVDESGRRKRLDLLEGDRGASG